MLDRKRPWRPYLTVARSASLAAPLSALGAFALLEWGKEPVAKTPELEVWKVLIAAQVAAWTMFFGVGIKGLVELYALQAGWLPDMTPPSRKLWRQETVRFVALIYGTISLLLVLGGLAGIKNPFLIAGQGGRSLFSTWSRGRPHCPSSWA